MHVLQANRLFKIMRKIENFHLLLMLIILVAVGQMAQTIYVPVIADIAKDLAVRPGAVQRVMAAYLLTYGASQLIYTTVSTALVVDRSFWPA